MTVEQHAAGQHRFDNAPPLLYLISWVALAGAAGALLRLGVGEVIPEQGMKFPWTTFVINLGGSALLGLLVGIVQVLGRVPGWVMPVLGTGLLGSFTTFSSVILVAVPEVTGVSGLSAVPHLPPGAFEMVAYLGISMLLCTVAAAVGITLGHALFGCSAMTCEDDQEVRR